MIRRTFCLAAALAAALAAPVPDTSVSVTKLDAALLTRATGSKGQSRVIVRTAAGIVLDDVIRRLGGTPGPRLSSASSQIAVIPDRALRDLANQPDVLTISLDRPVTGTLEGPAVTTGARWVQQNLGFDGSGVGVATIDSGVMASHDDLAGQRLAHFADFVNFLSTPYDDYGHGTHVAGIIAGSGEDSSGERRGVAPGASLIVLKALDAAGGGFTSSVIAAIDYAIANRDVYDIRVINLSVAAGVYESYNTDPLALAARRAVEAGIVVVAAAGNYGLDLTGGLQSGGITAPGNAPWVLTVGASNDMGTPDTRDDIVAPFSSRGPTAIDGEMKPDLVAPGVGIESTADPSGALFAKHVAGRLSGTVEKGVAPYLRLSGTSMAAPIVTGTIALMLQANPSLTPADVKFILQSSADWKDGVDKSAQGAGFLNARAAVERARDFSDSLGVLNDDLAALSAAGEAGVAGSIEAGRIQPAQADAAGAAVEGVESTQELRAGGRR